MDAPLADDERRRILDRIRAIPITNGLKFEIDSMERGACALSMDRDRGFDGIFDTIHGGLLMTLADSAAAFAILTLTGADAKMATTEMSIRFLAPARDRVTARAKVMKAGRRICFCEATIADARGAAVAHATITYMILEPRPDR
jgi:uncharacterized protein (TIGR00369 family)